MFNRRKLDGISFNYRISTIKKREVCTTCRAILGFVNSLAKNEHKNISSDFSINVLKDHKPIFSCSADKGNLSPEKIFCTNAIDQIQETSHNLHERKKFSVADILIRSFIQEQPQLSHVKHKQLPPQNLVATLTHGDQIKFKPLHCLVKQEIVLHSLKDDCHPDLTFIRNDQFPFGNDNEVETNVVKTMESFLFDAVQPIQVAVKKPITKNAKTLIKLFFSNTDNEDPVGLRKSRNNIRYRTDLVLVHKVDSEEKTSTPLINNLCTSEVSNDSEGKKPELNAIHQTNPSVMEQSLNNSSSEPSFFKYISQFNYSVFLFLRLWMKVQY